MSLNTQSRLILVHISDNTSPCTPRLYDDMRAGLEPLWTGTNACASPPSNFYA